VVTVTGSNFLGSSAVTVGGVAAAFTVTSDTSLTFTTPSEAAGTVDVILTTPTGTSAAVSADHFTYTSATAPSVTSLSSTSGSTTGGNVVNIYGSNFTGATCVSFGTLSASFTVQSDTWITAMAPAQAAATIDVTVTTPSGTSPTSSSDHYTFTAATAPLVTGLSPSSGPVSGGTTVLVTGNHFTGASAVDFGSTEASSFTVLSDTSLVVTAPSGTAGTVDVTVVTPSGISATSSADHYTYTSVSAPTVSSLGTTSGSTAGGTIVTITGSHFIGAAAVLFGTVPATSFRVVSDTTIFAVSPAESAGTVDVRVTTSNGTSSTNSGDQFTFVAPYSLTPTTPSFSPTHGTPWSGNLASFTSSNSGATASQFTAVINWGDGTFSVATISSNGLGGFNISGGHTYAW
jgi:hypothetical protein